VLLSRLARPDSSLEIDRPPWAKWRMVGRRATPLVWLGMLVGLLEMSAWTLPSIFPAASADEPLKTVLRQLRLGETDIGVAITEKPGSRLLYVNLHDDENTSAEAGHAVLKQSGGRLVELRHTGRRIVEFTVQGKDYRVDPNRIFTPAGLRTTLERQSHFSDDAARAVRQFVDELLNIYHIDRADAVIALHNNTPGMFSARSYAAGGIYARDAEDVFVREGNVADNFFFVTERLVFDALRGRGYNVVLQDNRRVTDDGSLSVYCGKANVRYVNVEAEQGNLKEQTRMIIDLKSILDELGPLKRP
jgi:hypothetical protein